jgi:hypothetical protein
MDPATLIAAILGAGGLGAIIAFRKTSAEAESVSVGTLRSVIEELRVEVERLRQENDNLRDQLAELPLLRERLRALEQVLDERGITPPQGPTGL